MLTSPVPDAGMDSVPDAHYAYLDLEVDATGTIYQFGLVSPNGEWDGNQTQTEPIWSEILHLHLNDSGLCGHNIRRFDYPHLVRQWAEFEGIAIIDTLELSVLALPLAPSHRLQKDYKLSQYASNNPLEDARATRRLLQDILNTWNEQPPTLLAAYRSLLTCGQDPADRAYQQFFARLNQPLTLPSLETLPAAAIAGMSRGYLAQIWDNLARLPFDERLCITALLSWNYARTINACQQAPSAWLSHLPPFYGLLEQLFPLLEDGFTYQPYFHEFGITTFYPPQEEAIQAIIGGKNPLILMATGGGKSLCYQLPALMFYRRQQGLTVCISPLQALMEDQVADLEEKGLDFATFINGTLPAAERSQRLEQVRDGWKGLLYISPEQLRSISIRHLLQERLPVLWVIDEAHCISQWGHDFRPDYRYVPKFIQEIYAARHQPLPRLALLTATATASVREDIKQLFTTEELVVHQEIIGEIKRKTLTYAVQRVVDQSDKDRQLLTLLADFKQPGDGELASGCVLIYTTTRKETERLAAMLNRHNGGKDFVARHYHGKISREDKSEILKAFKDGSLNIITATCAFGMGINRKDVRAVIHHTMSSSLEAYIQEAGRAGRDGAAATCTLLFQEQDADTIFFLKSLNQLTLLELRHILKAVRTLRDRIQKGDRDDWFWVTTDEIFQFSELDETFASEDDQRDTKLKVALHYLEEFALLKRAENLSSVVQFNLVHLHPQASCQQFEQYSRNHQLSELQTEQFRRLIYAMHWVKACNQAQDERVPLDRLSDDSGIPVPELTSRMRELQRAGVCSSEIPLTVLLTKRIGKDAKTDARNQHDRLRELEAKFLEALLPLMGEQNRVQINLRGMATRLSEPEVPVSATNLIDILTGWRYLKWVQWQRLGAGIVRLENLEATEWLNRHRQLSRTVLDIFYDRCEPASGKDIPSNCDLGELWDAVHQRTKPLSWTEAEVKMALFWLHQRKVLRLTDGLSLFHQSLKLRTLLNEKEEGKKEEKRIDIIDRRYPELQAHYGEQARRTHLMLAYGTAVDDTSRQALVDDYFSLPKDDFATAYPLLTSAATKRPLTQADYERIMVPLNPAQTAIVEAEQAAMVVIAGPGSGKTRTIVHRIAYLVKVKRISPDRILVLAYNRNAVHALRHKLKDLIGPLAFSLRVFTFHGLALALLGQTLETTSSNSSTNFDQLLQDAIALLEQAHDPEDDAAQAQVAHLLGTVEYVFVDEYQDVAEAEYRLIRLLSSFGRSVDDTRSVPINLCVIGDDDQNIYEFRGTNYRYIQDFQEEYDAHRLLLTENYRSTEPIITAANALIRHNPQRCKRLREEQVRIDHARQGEGGQPVRAYQFRNVASQAGWICEQVQSWLEAGVAPNEIVILAHQWKLLSPVRALLEQNHIATCALKPDEISLVRNQVTHRLLEKLRQAGVGRILTAQESVRDRFQAQFQHWGYQDTEPTVQTLLKIGSILDAERHYGSTDGAYPMSADEILTALFEFNQSGTSFFQENSVLVTSCHGAKGLEFRKVILLTDSFETRADHIEAARRLFYVAMTRAKEELVLCSTQPSRFVAETGIAPRPMGDRSQTLPQFLLYQDLTPGDVNLGHAATREQQNLITSLREGEPLLLVATQNSNGWTIRTQQRQIIGMLAKAAVDELRHHHIHPGQFQFQPGEVTVRYIYRQLELDAVTEAILADWFVPIPQIRVCR